MASCCAPRRVGAAQRIGHGARRSRRCALRRSRRRRRGGCGSYRVGGCGEFLRRNEGEVGCGCTYARRWSTARTLHVSRALTLTLGDSFERPVRPAILQQRRLAGLATGGTNLDVLSLDRLFRLNVSCGDELNVHLIVIAAIENVG